ncbi:MAG: putative lipid II flippase FtsW [bacterium]
MMEKRFEPDFVLFAVTLALLGIGTIMVYSASVPIAEKKFGSSSFFLWRHAVRVLLGLVVMFITARMDYHAWGKLSLPFLFVAFLLLVWLLVPGLPFTSEGIRGAKSWLKWRAFTLQPSEVAKLALVIYLADGLARRQHQVHRFAKGFLPPFVILCTGCGLILLQPDLGMAATISVIGMVLLFVGRAKMRHMVAVGLAMVSALGTLVYHSSYWWQKLVALLNPGLDPQGVGYHAGQSLISLGSGGLWGLGLGQGRQKLLYLPEAHTDFVFSVIGEELGFMGTMVVMALFLLLLWRGVRAARSAPDLFGFLLALGISFMIFGLALIHIGVVSAVLPTTGLPLPLVSYGGSSILLTLAGVGILLNISKQAGWKRVEGRDMRTRLKTLYR